MTSSMETFSGSLALCDRNPSVTGGFPSQRPVTRSFDVSLICAWIIGWAYNRDAGDLRRDHAHYDVTVMQRARETKPIRFDTLQRNVCRCSVPHFSTKIISPRIRLVRPPYHYNGNPYYGKAISLYWIDPLLSDGDRIFAATTITLRR